MDMKKEIKFSDLLPKRRKKDPDETPTPATAEEKPAKSKRSISFARKPKDSGEQAEGQPRRGEAEGAQEGARQERSRAGQAQEAGRPQDRRLSACGSTSREQRFVRARPGREAGARSGDHRRRRAARARGARRGPQALLQGQQAPEAVRAARHCQQPHRCPDLDIGDITARSSSRTRSASAPRRPCRSPSKRPSSTTRSSARAWTTRA